MYETSIKITKARQKNHDRQTWHKYWHKHQHNMYATFYIEVGTYLSVQINKTLVDKSKYEEYHVPLCCLEDQEIMEDKLSDLNKVSKLNIKQY